MAGEKTEKATPKRKEDERKKGNIFKSQELTTIFSMVVMFYSLKMMGSFLMQTAQTCITDFMQLAATMKEITLLDARHIFVNGCIVFAKTALPLLLISGAVAIVITLMQTKLLFSMESLHPKFSRMNPISGIKKMFSIRGIVELLKSIIKVLALGYLIYIKFADNLMLIPRLMDMEPMQAISFMGEFIMSIVTTSAAIFIFVAVGDYVYQWWDYEKNLRMSKDDIKEEYKQSEGDPQIKGKIKQKQRQMAQSRMMQDVPKADVVIRNPTHLAIALAYNAESHRAPVVLAKGKDLVALRIVKIAEENKVITVENKSLARALYDMVEVEKEIPEKFYQPVAEVLAFVYSLKEKGVSF